MLEPSPVALLALAALAGTASAEAAELPSFLFLLGDDIVSPTARAQDRMHGAFCPAEDHTG